MKESQELQETTVQGVWLDNAVSEDSEVMILCENQCAFN
jgi:hypothetical protein